MIQVPTQVTTAQKIFVNHSGGKDSQAMLAALITAGLKDKLVIIHCDLGEMEWEPMHDWIVENSFGVEVHVVKSKEDFFELSRRYNRLPSGQARFCTSDLKTAPATQFVRDYCKTHGLTNVVEALGLRAEESPMRAKKEEMETRKIFIDTNNRKAGKIDLITWHPILSYKLADVWSTIAAAGQVPHKVYSMGFSRLSCVFCVFGKIEEHKKAAVLRPELYQKMVALEKELGKSIRLKQVNGIKTNKYLTEYCGA
jgi:3'-phosphoadenosine 5'-phosphosulfate sulfotransferase (PAPS reductase)/FAD synthetase